MKSRWLVAISCSTNLRSVSMVAHSRSEVVGTHLFLSTIIRSMVGQTVIITWRNNMRFHRLGKKIHEPIMKSLWSCWEQVLRNRCVLTDGARRKTRSNGVAQEKMDTGLLQPVRNSHFIVTKSNARMTTSNVQNGRRGIRTNVESTQDICSFSARRAVGFVRMESKGKKTADEGSAKNFPWIENFCILYPVVENEALRGKSSLRHLTKNQ